MTLKERYPHLHLASIWLMPCYLFIVVCHLFFLPRFQQDPRASGTSLFQKNTQSVYYLVRNDRSVSGENQHVKTFPKTISCSWLTGSTFRFSENGYGALAKHSNGFTINGHYAWLSNSVMLI